MTDLPPVWIKVKGVQFLVTGFVAAVLLLLQHPTLMSAVLLIISIWSFCRFYYFAFYVIEHYVDPGLTFSGLIDFTKYFLFGRRE